MAETEKTALTYGDLKKTELARLTDAARYPLDVMQAQSRMYRPIPTAATISNFKTHELIMELLSRGFAVIKTPESGVPEVLTEK